MVKTRAKVVTPETDSESEQELIGDDENRLIDDEEFPISEDEEMNDDEEKEEEIEDETFKKTGWANSMAKILNSDKTGVLSKAKKVEDVEKKKEKKKYTFEIEGEVKNEADEKKPSEELLKQALEKRKRREKRENKIRVFNLRLKPTAADLDRERVFRKIATKGVVQLFNAVKSQHSDMERKLDSTKLESKRDEIIRSTDNKKNFLDALMSGPRSKSELVDKGVKKEKKHESSSSEDETNNAGAGKSNWSALRDDFMTGKKVGWDKDDDDGDDEDAESMESESE